MKVLNKEEILKIKQISRLLWDARVELLCLSIECYERNKKWDKFLNKSREQIERIVLKFDDVRYKTKYYFPIKTKGLVEAHKRGLFEEKTPHEEEK